MSDQTYEQLWKRLLVYSPNCPLPLAQEFVNTAYSRAIASHRWSNVRGYANFYVDAKYDTGTVSLVQDDATVTGAGTAWTSDIVGKQLIVGGIAPFYDIASVDTGAQTLELSAAYTGADASTQSYAIQQVYIPMPSDFLMFDVVKDIERNWRLRTDLLQKQIDMWDAKRTVTGTSWTMVYATPTSASPAIQRYELWPRSDAKGYSYTYIKTSALLSAPTDRPIYPLRGDIIREGALAELALWPGVSKEDPNPYYDLSAHRLHEKRFWDEVGKAVLIDQELNQTMVMYEDYTGLIWAPIDAAYIQSHDVF